MGLAGVDRVIGERGRATLVGGRRGQALTPPSQRDAADVARSFATRVAPAFGLDEQASGLAPGTSSSAGETGRSVRFDQFAGSVPVLAGGLTVRVSADGAVLSASGELAETEGADTSVTVAATAAADVAIVSTAKAEGVDPGALASSEPSLMMYDPELVGATDPLGPRMVWQVDVTGGEGAIDQVIDQFVLVDATSAAIALSFTQRTAARDRRVCTNDNTVGASHSCTAPVRTEAGYPSGNSDVDAAHDLSGVAYDFYQDLFGRDSIDDAGLPLVSTVEYCPPASSGSCPYRNAFWTGSQMVFGDGFADADDVVVHELTHGVIQHTAQLLYYSESGAINESLADVMGELADQLSDVGGPDAPADRWKLGEQLPIGAIRDMQNPGRYGDPDRMTSPAYWSDERDNYGVHINSGVNNRAAVLMVDGGTFNGVTVKPIGAVTTAQIYYEAMTSLLGPGSDYLDLYHALQQACTNLTSDGFTTADDCNQVEAAVTATEMNLAPITEGARLRTDRCDTDVTPQTLFTDDMEQDNGKWLSQSSSSFAAWRFVTGSSQSGRRSAYAPDRSSVSDASLVSALPVSVPSASTFLRFDHSFAFEFGGSGAYDGGVVEYSVDGPVGPWRDAGALPNTVNGYNAMLATASGNPLTGRAAFGRNSPGYQQTRIDLGSLAGAAVWLRFRVGSDEFVGGSGWFVDDVEVYTCGSALTSPAPTSPPSTTTTVPAPSTKTTTTTTVPAPSTKTTTTTTVPAPSTTVPSTTTTTTTVPASVPNTAGINPVGPVRLMDSRGALGVGVSGVVAGERLAAGGVLELDVAASGVVPGSGVGAVSLNVTVTEPLAAGFVTVFPCGRVPGSSSVNFGPGQTVANAVVSPVSRDGKVCVFALSDVHVIVDINAWFAD